MIELVITWGDVFLMIISLRNQIILVSKKIKNYDVFETFLISKEIINKNLLTNKTDYMVF